jgi:hypothetical protein
MDCMSNAANRGEKLSSVNAGTKHGGPASAITRKPANTSVDEPIATMTDETASSMLPKRAARRGDCARMIL